MANICVVDDKDILRESLETALTRDDHTVTSFGDPTEALTRIKSKNFDLVLCDLKMPKMDGLSVIRELRAGGCDVPVAVEKLGVDLLIQWGHSEYIRAW